MLKAVVKRALVRVGHELRGATILIDNTIAEALAWTFADDAGGVLGTLMELGATNLFSLSEFASPAASNALASRLADRNASLAASHSSAQTHASRSNSSSTDNSGSVQKVVFMVGMCKSHVNCGVAQQCAVWLTGSSAISRSISVGGMGQH
jgi:hypothetical protein